MIDNNKKSLINKFQINTIQTKITLETLLVELIYTIEDNPCNCKVPIMFQKRLKKIIHQLEIIHMDKMVKMDK
jgi:hypothetical protein